MKSLRSVLLASGLSLALAAAVRGADAEPGYVDFGQLMPAVKGEFVEVNLSTGMLKFAAKLVAREEPEVASLIAGLKRIRVNVIGMDDTNRASTVETIGAVRRKLETQGWTQMVTVREKNEGDNVDIHVKQRTDESIEGLVITVIDRKGEAVFVNIVGNIDPDQISKIADKLDIDPLRKIHVKLDRKHHEKDKDEKKEGV